MQQFRETGVLSEELPCLTKVMAYQGEHRVRCLYISVKKLILAYSDLLPDISLVGGQS